ncbi:MULTISPECIES: CHAT domain-containing protein [unclassified Streptomyces]|uniref:CHAT domain-containing protein n=1 Tax=unclassified Streptomyces TaxID=2593676 RepID=UPI00340EC8CE
MAAQDAATELVGLWPTLPRLVGPDWPRVRAQALNLVGRLGGADTDEERVAHTESLLELLLPYPAVAGVLGEAYHRGRRSAESVTDTPGWTELCRLLDAAPREQWITARFDADSPDGSPADRRTRRLVVGIDSAAHPYAFSSAQLDLTVPPEAETGTLDVEVYGAPEAVEVLPVSRSLVVRRHRPGHGDEPPGAIFDLRFLNDDRPVSLMVVTRTTDRRTPQQLRLTAHPSGLLKQENLLSQWRPATDSAAPPITLSLTLISAGGAHVLTAHDATGSATAAIPYSREELDALVREARSGIEALLLGPEGRRYESSLDIPEEQYGADLRRLARSGFDLFHALFRPDDGSADLRRIGDMVIDTLASAGPDSAPCVEVVGNGLNLPWHLMYAVDTYDDERLSPYRLLGLGARLALVPLRSGHHQRHRTEYVPRTAREATALIAVNTDIDRATTGQPRALVAGQVDYWKQRLAERAEVVDEAERVTEALRKPKRPDSLWYFYCHLVDGERGTPLGDAALGFIAGRQVGLRDARRDAPPDVPLPGAPLVVLNACNSSGRDSVLRGGFPSYFLSKGARAVVCTDIELPTVLGAEWARRFFDRLLAGTTVAAALHLTARDLVERHRNLLCLLYTAFGTAGVRMVTPA